MADLSSVARSSLSLALGVPAEEVATKLNAAVQYLTAANGTLVAGAAAVSSATSVDIVTGLTAVNSFVCQQKIGTAPTIATMTHTISGGTVTVFFWGPTAAGNTALTAVTAAPNLSWIATGTL